VLVSDPLPQAAWLVTKSMLLDAPMPWFPHLQNGPDGCAGSRGSYVEPPAQRHVTTPRPLWERTLKFRELRGAATACSQNKLASQQNQDQFWGV